MADQGPSKEPSKEPGIIRKLDECVVNRIAAGEVIQRPANALKELMENSLDAGATSIQITVKSGGLKLLQIQDNGCGIRREDFPIVCERFTTSKLKKFEDLEVIGTYGFRGEALASISHVAHVTITSKTDRNVCAYKGEYSDGKLKEAVGNSTNPRPCAGNQGTIIMVEDLFYNMDTRRRALKNPAEEHSKIVDVVTRYAVHNSKIGFIVKKADSTNVDMRTHVGSSTLDNIRILYGGQIARELLEVNCPDNPHYKMTGYVSNVNFNTKKFIFILFINHRLVDSTAIRKAVDTVYATHLPKGTHPFVYLNIEMNSKNVDVNVHPTKHEVHFLYEDIIVGGIANKIDEILLQSSGSRTFLVQSLLPGATAIETNTGAAVAKRQQQKSKWQSASSGTDSGPGKSKSGPIEYQKDMVRTDKGVQKLDKFLTSTPKPNANTGKFGGPSSQGSSISTITIDEEQANQHETSTESLSGNSTASRRRDIKLHSIRKLRSQIQSDCHNGLLSVFRNHTFVGCVDRARALIQHETKLYMVNTSKLSYELFYQKILSEFGNFGRIVINDSITIKELVTSTLEARLAAGNDASEIENVDEEAQKIQDFLVAKSKMLDDYFALKFDEDGHLKTLPLLLESYYPSMDFCPDFLIDLVQQVDWSKEKECFISFAKAAASFYAVKPGDDQLNDEVALNGRTWKWTIEHILFPEIKVCLLPPKIFAEDSTVVQLADLPELYKVFERC